MSLKPHLSGFDILDSCRLPDNFNPFKSILDDMLSGIILVNYEGLVIFASKIVQRWLKRSESECIGQSVKMLYPDRGELIYQRVREVFENGRPNSSEAQVEFPTMKRWLSSIYQPVYDQNKKIYAVQVIATDITDLKKTQENLLETQLFLNESQRFAKLGTFKWVLKTNVITWSDENYRIYGYEPGEKTPEELLGTSVHPEDQARWEEEIRQSFEGLRSFNLDYRIKRKDGSIGWVHSHSALIRNAAGKITMVWGVNQDITERVEAEHNRIDLENRLRQSQKMEAIGTLAGGIAHDFNNILSSIIGFTELAIDDVEVGSLTHDNLNEVITAGLRARDLIRHILTFSRQSELPKKPIPVSAIARESAKMLRATIPTTIKLHLEDQADSSTILGDAAQIQQVILNLCTNAAHAMEKDGGKLTIRLENIDADMETATSHIKNPAPGAYLKLSVSDTGTGMAANLIDRIFEPYMTTKESGKGTGLGLAVVHGIVHSHNGSICVNSKINQGTTMSVIFPLLQEEILPTTPTKISLVQGNEHILVVDDETKIVKMYRQMLERLGYTVSVYTDSVDAAAAFKADPHQFHAILTDMTMPNLTGNMLAKQIKTLRPDIPVIICTGFSERLSGKEAGDTDYDLVLIKPVVKTKLAHALRTLLDRRKTAA